MLFEFVGEVRHNVLGNQWGTMRNIGGKLTLRDLRTMFESYVKEPYRPAELQMTAPQYKKLRGMR